MEKGNFLTLRNMPSINFDVNEEVHLKETEACNIASIATSNQHNKQVVIDKINEYVNDLGEHVRDWYNHFPNEVDKKDDHRSWYLIDGIMAYENKSVESSSGVSNTSTGYEFICMICFKLKTP